jgi:hypothetical protein
MEATPGAVKARSASDAAPSPLEPREAADMLEARLARPLALMSRSSACMAAVETEPCGVVSVVPRVRACVVAGKGCTGEDVLSERQSNKSCTG